MNGGIKSGKLSYDSLEMENPYSTANGKGFIYFRYNSENYIMEVIFVKSKKDVYVVMRNEK